ncbi:MAG: patatin family protein [Dorea sp.]|nr:patatin family protein [Dorea sp.]
MTKATMVLEGGATRGVFTSGALDYLMEKDLYLSNVIGVSAGSCNAVDYVSKQIGRTRDCVIHREKEKSFYYDFRSTLKEKSLMNMDMLFDKYPNELFPFDFDTFFASEMECEIVATNCLTGKADYLTEKEDRKRLMKICRASSSMPLAAPITNVDGIPYLDGGLADSIPIERAIEKGNEKIVVILTRNHGYRKKRTSSGIARIYKKAYKNYPNVVRTMIARNELYNQQIQKVEKLEKAGKIFVLRPLIPTVSRMEKDYDVLRHFYRHGYLLMKREYQRLEEYLEK